MKSKLLYGVAAVVALLLLGNWLIGSIAQKNLETQIGGRAVDSGALNLITEKYEKKLFSSESQHRVVIADKQAAEMLSRIFGNGEFADQPAIIISSEIDHGPIPFTSLSRDDGSLAPAVSRTSSTMALDLGNGRVIDLPGKFITATGFGGSTASQYLLEKGSLDIDGKGSSLSWEGADISGEVSGGGDAVEAKGVIEPLQIRSAEGSLATGKIMLTMDQDFANGRIPVGDFSLHLDKAQFSSADGAGVVNNLNITNNSTEADGLLSGRGTFSVDKIDAGEMQDLSVTFNADYERLDIDTLANIQALNDTIRAAEQTGAGANDNTRDALLAELMKLAKTQPRLKISDSSIVLPQGAISLDADLNITKPVNDSGDYREILEALAGNANISVPAALVQMAQSQNPQVAMLVTLGVLKQEGDHYKLSAEYANRVLSVNGFPFPLPF